MILCTICSKIKGNNFFCCINLLIENIFLFSEAEIVNFERKRASFSTTFFSLSQNASKHIKVGDSLLFVSYAPYLK